MRNRATKPPRSINQSNPSFQLLTNTTAAVHNTGYVPAYLVEYNYVTTRNLCYIRIPYQYMLCTRAMLGVPKEVRGVTAKFPPPNRVWKAWDQARAPRTRKARSRARRVRARAQAQVPITRRRGKNRALDTWYPEPAVYKKTRATY